MTMHYTTAGLASDARRCRAKASEFGGPCAMKRYWEANARHAESLLVMLASAIENGRSEGQARIFQIVSN